ncbi:hypothetical protein [Bradyrhizobium sp. SZCCHNS3051]|uniref:hypothetical protein n=1 Tax=Bradyrhizobium sp. SZCCHNS3051 TaxID=3057320 RepID=UPI0029164AE4|nr:hypothetical protein [Bradyrhizobium sp. SZCCHNS3051]
MSPASRQRFVVTGFDYDVWRIVVEAASREEAINKAEAIELPPKFHPAAFRVRVGCEVLPETRPAIAGIFRG